jgi:hypothetical protein
MEPLPYTPWGGIASPLLETELRPMLIPGMEWQPAGVWLRIIDPRNGEPIPVADEEHDALRAAREQVAVEERGRLMAERHAADEEQARLATERHAADEEQARLVADQRVEQAEAELQELRATLARRQSTDPLP